MVIAQVARVEQLAPEERLDPERLVRDLQTTGKHAAHIPEVDTIVDHLARETQGGDVVCLFSNGGFGDIYLKLLNRLGKR